MEKGRKAWRWSWTATVVLGLLLSAPGGIVGHGNAPGAAAQSSELEEVIRLAQQALKLYHEGRYDEAIPFGARALELCEKKLGAEHPAVASMLNNLALFYEAKGDYTRVELLYKRAVAIYEKARGPDHPHLAAALDNLAGLYKEKGEYTRAEPLYNRALSILEKAHGPQHTEVAKPLNNLALLYMNKGDYGRAESLFQRALSILEKAHGSEHAEVATAVSNLGLLYEAKGDYARAEPLANRALAIKEKVLGAEHPDFAISLNNLADMYRAKGDYARAESLYQRALAIKEKALGAEHPSVGTSLNGLALMYQAKGDYARAESLYQRTLAIIERVHGAEHPNVASLLHNLAVLYELKGDTAQAVRLFARGNDIRERNLTLILTTGSEEQKRMYLDRFYGDIGGVVSFHVRSAPRDPQAARLALSIVLRRKGRALDAMSDQIESLRRRANPEDRALLEQLAAARSRLANMQLKGPGRMPPAEFESETAKHGTEAERLEALVGSRSAEFRAQSQPVTIERVQAAIPTDAALVDVALYKPFNAKARTALERFGAPRYVAYVLRPRGEPEFVELGAAEEIDAGVERLRAALRDAGGAGAGQASNVKQAARALDEGVMRPVRALLGATRRIFLAPDGALNLIPFAALVDERGRYLVEDYSITYLTSGRDLLRLQVSGAGSESSLIFADPVFDARKPSAGSPSGVADDGGARRSADMTEMRFTPLPGTAGEAKTIGSLLNVTPFTQAQATEAALKRVASPRILHIATHGFFLPDEKQEAASDGTRGLALVGARRAAPLVENPLLRSGLALAGANAGQGADGEDGILTALEAAGLNLWGTKLVVLSACETGVGTVSNGNGVYGLRRALVLAGSESQVMSLWQVSDEATRDLMVAYYKRLQAGEGRTDALRAVQLEMIKSGERVAGARTRVLGNQARGAANDRSHPYFWAAFIQSGDWRGMDDKTTPAK
ncbi:MAG: tetratricopeptide repeat protein [Rubrivivax sp.]|nr:tetratricopeptide repeat protein [Pyrinomonadaceae bacterium]